MYFKNVAWRRLILSTNGVDPENLNYLCIKKYRTAVV